jgi:hypothetical protein
MPTKSDIHPRAVPGHKGERLKALLDESIRHHLRARRFEYVDYAGSAVKIRRPRLKMPRGSPA